MRALLALALLMLPIAVTPAALAAASQLSIDAPEGPLAGDATVPVTIRLTVSDFMCSDARQFVVTLATSTTEGVKALFDKSQVALDVPAHSYYVDQYTAEATVNLSVRALQAGQVTMSAHFEADVGPCFVPGGFDPAEASVTRDITAATTAPSESTSPPPTHTSSSTTPPENATSPTPTSPTTQPPTSPSTPTSSGQQGCAPDKSCGAIGEYQPPAQESSSKATPFAPIALSLVAIAVLSITMRRRSR